MAGLLLSTGRLTLRPFREVDLAALQQIGNRPEVARMMASIPLPWHLDAVRAWVAAGAWRGLPDFRFGVFDSDNRLIGAIGLEGRPPALSFFLTPDCWGRGYASEALEALLDFVFGRFSDLAEVTAEHLEDNPASGAVLRKSGFVEAGQSTCRSSARVEAGASRVYRLTRQAHKAQHDEIS
ncbi:GNAT family N-acetyltransferase [Shimia sp.]|uniref:GNAT family N-acetyltransferase n=1 Tax=Shimia sp. TaxID=1954381 RepID=UPI00356B2BEF